MQILQQTCQQSLTVYCKHYILQIRLKDALNNFFTSPAWEEMKGTGEKIRYKFMEEGFTAAWDELILSIDPEGETHAYRVRAVSLFVFLWCL